MDKKYIIGAVVGFVLCAAVFYVLGSTGVGGELFTNKPSFVQGFFAGRARQLEVDASGGLRLASTTIGSSTFRGEITMTNCGSKSSVVIPAISGLNTTSGDTAVATSVTVGGLAAGDATFAAWNPGHATGTLPEMGLTMTVNASTTGVATVQFQNYKFTTSTVGQAGGSITVCYFD